jgi:heavy metal translocating P-type ATPase
MSVAETAASPNAREHVHGDEKSSIFVDIARISLIAAAAVSVWFVRDQFAIRTVITVAALAIGGFPIFEEAWENIVQRRMTMELSMALAIAAAAAIGEYFTALIIALFVLVAEVLADFTVDRGRRAVASLLGSLPNEVELKVGNMLEKHSIEELMPSDIILIRPGGQIPVDGIVVAGCSSVYEAALTGEPLPATKQEGSTVLAGTINQTGALEVQVVAVGKNTTFAKIIEAVEHAERTRAPIQKTADHLAGYLVYVAFAAAAVTFLVTRQIRPTISVVIVAGACGGAAGTPLAVLGAIGRCARQGVILKGGIYLEALWDVDTVVLDKTGTVTFGSTEVVAVTAVPGVSEDHVVATAALAERNSEHPLARAIVDHAGSRNISPVTPDRFSYHPGKGVLASLGSQTALAGTETWLIEHGVSVPHTRTQRTGTHILVAEDGKYLVQIVVADRVRHEARQAIEELHGLGLGTVLLTGDSDEVARSVGSSLSIQTAIGALLPHQKSEYVRALVSQGRKTVMVGDGVNDAPALAEATVGIAMGSGTDVARETADALLMGNDLLKLVAAFRTSRWCRRIIMQNFYGTVLVDLVGIGFAAMGMINPLTAAFIHVASELTFILNSTRLLSRRP